MSEVSIYIDYGTYPILKKLKSTIQILRGQEVEYQDDIDGVGNCDDCDERRGDEPWYAQ